MLLKLYNCYEPQFLKAFLQRTWNLSFFVFDKCNWKERCIHETLLRFQKIIILDFRWRIILFFNIFTKIVRFEMRD